ncbi:MAG TPA: FkbM family methyltransferase, partial [Gemmatimonadales bacterium]|nr:FkbM family methyltransferase [Gemmatimonadales bacterium]
TEADMEKLDALKYAQRLSSYVSRTTVGKSPLVRGIKQLARRALERWFSQDGVLIAPVHGLRMSVPAGRYLYVYRAYEPYTTELFANFARTNAAVLDIGACFGYYSLLAAQALEPGGVVYAFEPSPESFAVLVRNIELNGYTDRIVPLRKAVGARSETRTLHLSTFAENNSLSSSPLFPTPEEIEVAAVSIDEILQDQRVALIKMDIEGLEPRALEGMRRTLERNRDVVLFTELNVETLRALNVEPAVFLAQLQALGFHVQLIDETGHRLLPVTAEAIGMAELEPGRYSNLLCVRKD